jgi:bifunctional UDP-N-acetylglucosamine pyrophosphorylase/glucosamine-1-phosphate N-acetyltransferase
MRPLTDTRPKPLVPVGEKTLVEGVMEVCAPHVDGFVVVVGYMSEEVRTEVGDEFDGKEVEYVVQEERAGTADAVAEAANMVGKRFLVTNGDLVFSSDTVGRLVEEEGNAVSVKGVEQPSEYGVVETNEGDGEDDGNKEAVGIVEKPDEPPTDLANAGVYVFDRDALDYVRGTSRSERGEEEITSSIADMMEDGYRFGVVEHDYWLDVGYPWDLLKANGLVLTGSERRVEGVVENGATLKRNVVVEEGARVLSGAYIEGPVLVREGAEVGPNAYVRGATVVGEDVEVGNSVEVKNSVLMRGTSVSHLSYVGDSVLGEDTNFGAGTVVANLRHDDGNVGARVKGDTVDTGRRKFGVVVGDGAKTGINTSLNAGVRVGVGETTAPGETVMKDRGVEDGGNHR